MDLYFYRDPEEVEKEEQAALEKAQFAAQEAAQPQENWNADMGTGVTEDCSADVPAAATAAAAVPAPAPGAGQGFDDWSAPPTKDWSAAPGGEQWGGNTEEWS